MAINTNTVAANLTTKLNATTGTTDAKEFLLLGKAVEALTPSVTVQDVIDEGTTQTTAVNTAGTTQVGLVQTEGATQVAAVQAAAGGFISNSGGSYTGGLTGDNLTLSGNLTVSGTTTTIDTTNLTVSDANITIADGAADAAAANGAGITIDGANATMTYVSSTDSIDFNKDLRTSNKVYFANMFSAEGDLPSAATYHGMFAHVHGTGRFYGSHAGAWYKLIHEGGTYNNLQPEVTTVSATSSQTIDFQNNMQHVTMTGNTTFSGVSLAQGRTCMVVLDRSASSYTPSWGSDFKWPDATEPTWGDYRYWIVSLTCLNGTTMLASASGYTV